MLPPEGERLWTLNAVRVPDGVDEAAVRKHLLDEFNIEIGAGLGPLAGKIWRVGLMGASSSPRLVLLLRGALESALARRDGTCMPETQCTRRVKCRPNDRNRLPGSVACRDDGLARGSAERGGTVRVRRLRVSHAARRSAARSDEPATTAFIELRARGGRASGRNAEHVQRWIALPADLAGTETRGAGRRRRRVLAARRRRLRRAAEIDRARLGARPAARGASTITQQLAKNLYLSPSRNPLRKFRELIIARRLEAELSKTRILELYLNVIEWGDGDLRRRRRPRRTTSTSRRRRSAGGVGAARRRHHQSAGAQPGASDGAPEPASADHPETYG